MLWVINSAVECLPYKQKVTGSNPVLPKDHNDPVIMLGLSSNGLRLRSSKPYM